MVDVEQTVPVVLQLCEGHIDLLGGVELLDGGVCLLLVDDLRGGELLVLFILHVAEQEDEVFRLAWLQRHLDIVGGNGAPAVCVAVAGTALHDGIGVAELVVETHEGLTVGVEALYLGVDVVEGVVVATLAVLGLVVDGCARRRTVGNGGFYLDLAG